MQVKILNLALLKLYKLPREPDPDRFRPRDPCPAPRAARAWNAKPRHVTRVVASTGVVSVSAESQDANLLGENKRTR